MDIHGCVAPGFDTVAEEFASGLADGTDVGAALCVIHDGDRVVDLWGGHRDQARGEPWESDTLCPVMSVGKAWLAVLAMTLVESEVLVLGRPVASYWPEFAAGGKTDVTLEHVLTHRAGLPFHDELSEGADWTRHEDLAAVLAGQSPLWPDLKTPAYHPLTFGTLIDALLRRAAGMSAALYLASIAAARGLDISFGCSPRNLDRRAEAGPSPTPPTGIADGCDPDPRCRPSATEPRRTYELVNSPAFGQSEWPSINGYATAQGLAGFYAALVDPGAAALLTPQTIANMSTVRWARCELSGGQFMRMGLGVNLGNTDSYWFGPTDSAFGHVGKGGSTGFADPARHLAVGYVTNSHYEGAGSGPRLRALAHAIHAAVTRARA